MKNGFEIEWSDHAISELRDTFEYLQQHFSEKELKKLFSEIERV